MNIEEASKVLGKIQHYDKRNVDQGSILAWSEALEDVSLQDALDAVGAYHKSGETGWLMPGHIIQLVAKAKDRRRELLHAAGPPDYPSDLTHAQEQTYRKLYQGHVKAGRSRDEATALADHEFGANRLQLVEASPEIKAALAKFAADRAIR